MKKKLNQTTIKTLTPDIKPYEVNDTEIKGFLLRVQPSGVMTYYFSYRNQEYKRQRIKIGLASNISPEQARDDAKAIAGKVVEKEDVQAIKKQGRSEARSNKHKTLGGFIEHKYREWVLSHRKSGKTTLAILDKQFTQFYDRPLTDITPWIVEKWRTDRIKSGITKSTVNRNLAALKTTLSKAVEWGIIDIHPLAKLKIFKTDKKKIVRYLSPEEGDRLREALAQRDRQIIADRKSGNAWRKERDYKMLPNLSRHAFGDHLTPMTILTLNTGLRRGEVFNLHWSDINFQTKSISVKGATAKSGDTRHVSLNKEALATLTAWLKQTKDVGLVFPSVNDKPFHTIKRSWGNLMKAAKIPNFRFHDLRHDFASKLVMAGVPLNTVRELLGHADLKTTLIYAHLAPDHKAQAVERLSQ